MERFESLARAAGVHVPHQEPMQQTPVLYVLGVAVDVKEQELDNLQVPLSD